MRFIIGLLLGLGVGFAAALLFAPEKGTRRGEGGPPGDEAAGVEGAGEDHDALVVLQRAMRGLQEQVREAWGEARQAAEDAEREMRARYERTVGAPAHKSSEQ